MLKKVNIFFFIFSLVLNFFTPDDYNYTFCLLINIAFLLQNSIYFVLSRRSLVSFEFFFMFAFYFVNFIYPVAYFPNNPTYGVFKYDFNYQIISKATAVAYVAYTIYMFGLTYKKTTQDITSQIDVSSFSKSFFPNLLIVFLGLAVSYIASVGYAFFSGYDWYVEEENYSPVVSFINMSASLFAMFLFFKEKKTERRMYAILLLTFISVYLISGSRNMPLGLLSIFVVTFHERVRKIPSFVFLLSIVGGMIVFYVISLVRVDSIMEVSDLSGSIATSTESSVFNFASDLVYNNRNLYVLMDFADNFGYTYGLTMLSSFLGLIPYAGTLVSNMLGVPLDFMYVAGFNTFLEFGLGSTFGLGGNMVADVYLSFGFPGVLVLFFSLGVFMSNVIGKYRTSIGYYIIYFTMLGNAVFVNRESFFLPLRPILYSILMFWILNKLFKNFTLKSKISAKQDE